MEGVNQGEDSSVEKSEFDYAWNWFQYHAAQRLTAFNFFLVLVGFLLVAYAQAVHYGWGAVGCALGLLGALVSFAFWALDVRNEELIQCGWAALTELEKDAPLNIVAECDDRTHLKTALGRSPLGIGLFGARMTGTSKRVRLFKHRTWLRLIMAAVGIAFSVGTVWAMVGFPGAHRPPAGHGHHQPWEQPSAEGPPGSGQSPSKAPPGSEQKRN
jgi:hypothetical protein